ncbi:MAG: hypothetical protein JZD41_05340 [Thermoproteus sp.]|nr:hypothetical protein [Thermoproteus sp.]
MPPVRRSGPPGRLSEEDLKRARRRLGIRLSTGAKWGALVGLASGAVSAVLIYAWRDYILSLAYEQLRRTSVPLTQSQLTSLAETVLVISMASAVVGGVVFFTIIGLIMAAVWGKLRPRISWYGVGAAFGLALILLSLAGSLPLLASRAPPLPLQYLGWPQDILFPLLLAFVLEKKASAS